MGIQVFSRNNVNESSYCAKRRSAFSSRPSSSKSRARLIPSQPNSFCRRFLFVCLEKKKKYIINIINSHDGKFTFDSIRAAVNIRLYNELKRVGR